MNYYVYKILNKITNEFYIGYRGSKKSPLRDIGIKYFTSGVLKNHFRENVKEYQISILFESENERVCFWTEQKHIKENIDNEKCKNKSCSKLADKLSIEQLCASKKVKARKVKEVTEKKIWSNIKNKYVIISLKEYKKLKGK